MFIIEGIAFHKFRHLLISRLMPAVIYNVPEFRHQINDRTLGRACTSQPGATENQDSENVFLPMPHQSIGDDLYIHWDRLITRQSLRCRPDGGDSISVTLADNTKIVGQPFASNPLVEESPVIQEPATAVRALTLLNQAGSIRGSSTHTP